MQKVKLGNGLNLTIHRVEIEGNKVIWHCSLKNDTWQKYFQVTFGENRDGIPTFNPINKGELKIQQ